MMSSIMDENDNTSHVQIMQDTGPPVKEEHFKFYSFCRRSCASESFNAIIAGSSVLAMSFRQKHSYVPFQPNDVDIFTDYETTDVTIVEDWLDDFQREHDISAKIINSRFEESTSRYAGDGQYNIEMITDVQLSRKIYVTDPSVEGFSRFSTTTKDVFPPVQIIFVSYRTDFFDPLPIDAFTQLILKSFDISVCQVAYNQATDAGDITYLDAGVEADIQYKKMRLYLLTSKQTRNVHNRLSKYMSRGFSLVTIHFREEHDLYIIGSCLLVRRDPPPESIPDETDTETRSSDGLTMIPDDNMTSSNEQ